MKTEVVIERKVTGNKVRMDMIPVGKFFEYKETLFVRALENNSDSSWVRKTLDNEGSTLRNNTLVTPIKKLHISYEV